MVLVEALRLHARGSMVAGVSGRLYHVNQETGLLHALLGGGRVAGDPGCEEEDAAELRRFSKDYKVLRVTPPPPPAKKPTPKPAAAEASEPKPAPDQPVDGEGASADASKPEKKAASKKKPARRKTTKKAIEPKE
jgi:hypothetical protein